MTNHPSRSRGPYTVRVTSSDTTGPVIEVPTVAAAKVYAQGYGQTADQATVWDKDDEVVCTFTRNGLTWRRNDWNE
jgi:hypothetical protein